MTGPAKSTEHSQCRCDFIGKSRDSSPDARQARAKCAKVTRVHWTEKFPTRFSLVGENLGPISHHPGAPSPPLLRRLVSARDSSVRFPIRLPGKSAQTHLRSP